MKKLNKGVDFILPHLFLLLEIMILSIIKKTKKNIKICLLFVCCNFYII